MTRIKNIFNSILASYIRNIGGTLGRRLRRFYYKKRLGSCGKGVNIDVGVIITNPKDVFLGDKVWIDNYALLLTGKPELNRKTKIKDNPNFTLKAGQLKIGDNVHIGPHTVIQSHGGISIDQSTGIAAGTKIYSYSHHYRNLNDPTDKSSFYFTPMVDETKQFMISSSVTIGKGCAIGLNCVILPGTAIPDGTWIGVNTTVSGQNIQKDAIYVSETAKFLKDK